MVTEISQTSYRRAGNGASPIQLPRSPSCDRYPGCQAPGPAPGGSPCQMAKRHRGDPAGVVHPLQPSRSWAIGAHWRPLLASPDPRLQLVHRIAPAWPLGCGDTPSDRPRRNDLFRAACRLRRSPSPYSWTIAAQPRKEDKQVCLATLVAARRVHHGSGLLSADPS